MLKFGTVSWELDVIKQHGLDKAAGIDLDIVELANNQATAVALQAGEVDVIVTDWLWVSRQRADGAPFTFAPYSTSVGSLMVSRRFADQESRRPYGQARRDRRRTGRQELAGHPRHGGDNGTVWSLDAASRRFSPRRRC